MDSQQIKAFIDAMAASDLDEMEVSHDGWTLRLVRNSRAAGASSTPAAESATPSIAAPTAPPAPRTPATASCVQEVAAPMFGVVHLQQASGEPSFVKVGDVIEAGQLLCTIEAMKVFNEVRAEHAGRVVAVHVTSAMEVEGGQPLFSIEGTARV